MSILQIPKRGFSAGEFEGRVERARKIMHKHKFDALVVSAPPNVRYFTGFDSQFWESPTRPWFVVVGLEGDPVAVIPEIGAPEMALTWMKDIRTWPAPVPEDDGISLLKSTIESFPKKYGRVGAEMGREMSLRMPVSDLLRLRDSLSSEIADGSPCIWEIRMVKTAAEIEHINHICQIASDAYEALPAQISAGETEREIARKLRIDIARRGADATPFMPAISGPGGVAQIVCGPHDRAIQEGDILFIDTGSTFDGYFCDFDRNYAVGKISDDARRVHDALWLATEAGIAAAVPGATTDDVFRAMSKIIEEAGAIGNNVGRLGHGLGLQLTEPPSHRLGDGTVILENMVLTIEPGMEYAPGKMIVHEENIAITNDGPRLLTKRAPREMPVIN
ncbi:Xaa-Pro peptidase family protein [Shinella curvata]|uniref:Xaa-Pro peptidase family protein n=1 Tax=Shinella curvata TaxID=1817964 RepID=A0ABT8XCI1_9HYPH|nr:Xaa-Pro peptidase family protein [Shinella curvata]MCJ8054655.1 Xaa-Pro peptidase family protein [Shinella curvata]MDO6120950.1 Xaa-Pro peptidase family protein [Shinella curvata]